MIEILNNFEFVSVISGVIASISALISINLTYQSNKKERESKRPYFTIKAPGFKQLDKCLRFQITFFNCGVNTAHSFKGEIRIFDINFENEIKIDIDVVNDIPKDIPTPYYNDSIILNTEMPKHYIFCNIFYNDTISHKKYNQIFFMKWDGVKNGKFLPDFNHVNSQEKKLVEDFIAKH